ncbi:MAG: SDR family oxidoreductase [Allosphingosinicella sp.]|uniref:SDR family oxidoreductase n=1 Tax=Allosphingosinicella sp. TaxID=2823234 RepID=UPI0039400E01
MRILLVGATGLIGSAVAARLTADGHDVTALARRAGPAARRLSAARWIARDLRTLGRPEDWRPLIAGCDAVVYCAGVLQDGGRDATGTVHRDAPAALWEACASEGVRRVVHFSAMGVDRGALTPFSESKAAGDAALMAHDLDWVILRPSVVVGRAAFGGSALFRGLAALPVRPRTEEAGPLDIVQLDDVVETVARLVRPDAPARVALELAGPERLSFDEVVDAYRAWLGWRPARLVRLPSFAMVLAWRLGDLAGRLGWRPPVRSTARREIVRGAVGDPGAWTAASGVRPRPLRAALAAEPASVQERWFARLFLLKPLALAVFAAFWILTGLISLGPGYALARWVMEQTAAAPLAEASVILGSLVDLAVGIAILFRRTAKAGLIAALAVSLGYIAAGTALLPNLWLDPLGPMLKIWPILALNLMLLAILDER